MRKTQLVSLLVLSLALGAAAVACDEDTGSTASDPSFEGGVNLDGGTPSDGATTTDTGAPQADAGDGGAPKGSMIRVANLRNVALDVCLREGTVTPGPFFPNQPTFKDDVGGVPPNNLSRWIPVPNVNFTVVYVPAGSDCSATPISDSAVTLANVVGDVRNTLVLQQTSTLGFNQTAADTIGKDNVFVFQNGQSTAFVGPDGGTTALAFRDVTLLDPGLTGTMTASPSGATRPYRTAAGRVTMFATNAGILLCDDSVVNGHLVKCDLDVRKP